MKVAKNTMHHIAYASITGSDKTSTDATKQEQQR